MSFAAVLALKLRFWLLISLFYAVFRDLARYAEQRGLLISRNYKYRFFTNCFCSNSAFSLISEQLSQLTSSICDF